MSAIHLLKEYAGYLWFEAFALVVVVIPMFLLSTIVCFIFRRSRWIAPLWLFFAGPILLLLACTLPYLPQIVRSVFTADRNDNLMAFCELVLEIAFLLAYPRGAAWGSHVKIPCLIACVLSIIAIVLWIYLPFTGSSPF
jgi:hypothetical protein